MYERKQTKSERRRARAQVRRIETVWEAFDPAALKAICEMDETEFADDFGLTTVGDLWRREPGSDFYLFKDNGADILSVAHLDTVVPDHQRMCGFIDTAGGPIVYSGALDDRLGAYILLDLLPRLGIVHDVLLTVGEEQGQSTAECFNSEKPYNWMIEFDRGGTDVVMYQYDDDETADLVRACGAKVGQGSFSDIAFLEQLEIKGFNWGVGYADYHGPRSHAYLDDTVSMVARYLKFHEANAGEYLPHDAVSVDSWWGGMGRQARHWWDEEPTLMEQAEAREAEIIDALAADDADRDRDEEPDFNENPTQVEIAEALAAAAAEEEDDPAYRRSLN